MKFLVVRDDKVGDLALAWPSLALLKYYIPDAHITLLVQQYTYSLAKLCPWTDDILVGSNLPINKLKQAEFDVVIALRSTKKVALAGMIAGIPYRLAPATKWWQIFYNHRLTQRRSNSLKPEYAYNLDLIYKFLYDHKLTPKLLTTYNNDGDYLSNVIHRPLLHFNNEEVNKTKMRYLDDTNINNKMLFIVIHPGSGGSANNLTLPQYIHLITEILSRVRLNIKILISVGKDEIRYWEHIRKKIGENTCVLIEQRPDISWLAQHIAFCDLFISNSTGPLHLAGLLNRNTAGFYPNHQSGSSLRWQTLNEPSRRLIFTPQDGSNPKDVTSIDLDLALHTIIERLYLIDREKSL